MNEPILVSWSQVHAAMQAAGLKWSRDSLMRMKYRAPERLAHVTLGSQKSEPFWLASQITEFVRVNHVATPRIAEAFAAALQTEIAKTAEPDKKAKR